MDNANTGATKVFGLKGFNFTNPPVITGRNTSLVAIPAFEHGGNEHEHYYFHPDHLGSSNYITNFVGEVSQHMEYFAFGETFIEEHKNSHNSPYKFNGKELDEETGLYYYGARYYDPRISIWLSVDNEMEKYPNWSPYNYCKQSPISRYDPDGNDDIFTSSGRFVRSTKTGNSVLIQVGDKQLTPSQLSTSRGSRLAMTRVGAHYAAKVGADAGTKITTGKSDTDSDKNAAFTRGQTISLNTNGGFSKDLDNISNFKSVIKHENFHKEDNEKSGFSSNLSTHADVYINQMSDKSFSGTTDDFKTGMAGSFANYLLNMDQPGSEFDQTDIDNKINTFNTTNTGGLQIQRTGDNFGNHPKGTLNLEFQYKGKTYGTKYEKINE